MASVVPVDYNPQQLRDKGMRSVQSEALPAITPSKLRRLTFYSDKTILALFDLANEDIAAGQNGATISSDTTDALRTAIQRLIDAGAKADLTVDQVAIFFGQEVAVRFSGPLPIILQDAEGNLAAKPLFRGVAESSMKTAAVSDTTEYLSLLTAESQSMTAPSETEESEAVVETVAKEERPPEVQSILDRAVVENGQRTIKVQTGDTLASYANAFYKDTLLYRAIYSANANTLENPNLLVVGQVLVIPEQ